MKLHEKIYYCRKKAGLSQDGLAELLDVSRQAISKWENGEAMPETAKLPALAKAFGVSIDWLLSEEEPVEEEVKNAPASETVTCTGTADWMDRLPGFLGKMARRWGWLAGVYVAVAGAVMALFGTLAKVISSVMVKSYTSSVESMTNSFFPSGGMQILDEQGNVVEGEMADAVLEAIGGSGFGAASPFGDMLGAQSQVLQNNPVDIVGTVLIVLGLLVLVGGIILAVWLRKWGKANS